MAELMKGKSYFDRRPDQITWPMYEETKHDEIRCHVKSIDGKIHFLSYAGKPLANMEVFAPAFMRFMAYHYLVELDLGFEVNGNFNDSYRWVRSTNGLPAELIDASTKFYLYAVPEYVHPYMDEHYASILPRIVDDARSYGVPLHLIPASLVHSHDEMIQRFMQKVEQGFEGLMLKVPGHLYKRGKRTADWLKVKPEETADGEIIELIEAVAKVDQPHLGICAGDPLGRTGSVLVRLEDGSTATPHGIAHALGTEMHQNPQAYLGEWCEFKYMMRDRQGGYRHPVFKRLREAKK